MALQNTRTAQPKKTLTEKLMERWWGACALGAICVIFAVYEFGQFAKLDSGELEEMRVNSLTALLYNLGGKWPPTLLFVLAGLGLIGYGINQLLNQLKAKG
jgi:hypothetical protein